MPGFLFGEEGLHFSGSDEGIEQCVDMLFVFGLHLSDFLDTFKHGRIELQVGMPDG